MKKRRNNFKTIKPQKWQNPSAESVLKWLDEANRFVQLFLSPKDFQRYRKIKNDF